VDQHQQECHQGGGRVGDLSRDTAAATVHGHLCDLHPHARHNAAQHAGAALLLKSEAFVLLVVDLAHSEQGVGPVAVVQDVHTHRVHANQRRVPLQLCVGLQPGGRVVVAHSTAMGDACPARLEDVLGVVFLQLDALVVGVL
jgi:hypothetical protein